MGTVDSYVRGSVPTSTVRRRRDRGGRLGRGRLCAAVHRRRSRFAVRAGVDPRGAADVPVGVRGPGSYVTIGGARMGDDLDLRSLTDSLFAGISPAGPVIRGALDTGFSPERAATADGLLVGDAAGLVNPFTGEGLSYAVRSALLASAAIVASPRDPDAARQAYAGRLAGYFETARHAARRYQLMWRVLADATDSVPLRQGPPGSPAARGHRRARRTRPAGPAVPARLRRGGDPPGVAVPGAAGPVRRRSGRPQATPGDALLRNPADRRPHPRHPPRHPGRRHRTRHARRAGHAQPPTARLRPGRRLGPSLDRARRRLPVLAGVPPGRTVRPRSVLVLRRMARRTDHPTRARLDPSQHVPAKAVAALFEYPARLGAQFGDGSPQNSPGSPRLRSPLRPGPSTTPKTSSPSKATEPASKP